MKAVLYVALRFFALGAGAGAAIMLIDYIYRMIYVTSWRAGWNAHNAYRAKRRIQDMKKRDRRMYMYSINAGEEQQEIVKEEQKTLEAEAETIAQ